MFFRALVAAWYIKARFTCLSKLGQLKHIQIAGWVRTSGFIVSSDGGETWEASKMLIPNVEAKHRWY